MNSKLALDKILERRDLGFWQLPERNEIWRSSIEIASELRNLSDHLVVLGMGGSSLGGRCLVECLASHQNRKHVTFLNNTDPTSFARVFENENQIESAHFLAISKSGTTLEVACMLDVLTSKLRERNADLYKRISIITEPERERVKNPLRRFAEANSLRVVDHPLDVGGRFSAFTPVGLIPAAFSGVDIMELREGARMVLRERKFVEDLAAQFVASFKRGEVVTAFWSYVEELAAFLPWLQQLWAESLGKSSRRNGEKATATSVPVIYQGTCDQHSVLQQLMDGLVPTAVVFFRDKGKKTLGAKLTGDTMDGFKYLKSYRLGEVFDTQSHATEKALCEVGRTAIDIEFDQISTQVLGRLIMAFELVVGTIGELLEIDVFNQPGVELGKKITKAKLQESAKIG